LEIDLIVIGPASVKLGSRLTAESSLEAVAVEHKTFPDGESYIRINGDVSGKRVLAVQSTYPPQDRHLMQLYLIIDALKDLGAEKVYAAVPYLAYARQDGRFRSGEAVSVNTVIKLLEALRVDGFITFNIHKQASMEAFHIPALNLSAMPAIGAYVKELGARRPLVVAPDEGAVPLAEEVAEALNAEYTWFEKRRDRSTGRVETSYRKLDVKGRDVLIVDDIVSTGSTIANVAQMVKAQGARRVLVGCVHALLAENALERMKAAGVDLLLGPDTVEGPVSQVSVASLLLEGARRIV
jgi:ribose-phosphate pyrophosphokinase